jgi:hypothetical protein
MVDIKIKKVGATKFAAIAIDATGNRSLLLTKKFIYDFKAPVLKTSLPSGNYAKLCEIRINANEEAFIYYTLDRTPPTRESILFRKTILLSRTGNYTLRSIAFDKAGNKSKELIRNYTVDLSPPAIDVRIESDRTGQFYDVSLKSNETSEIFYTLDGRDPTFGSPTYRKPIRTTAGKVLKYFAVDKMGNRTKIFTLEELKTPSVRVEPKGGTYNKRIEVSLSTFSGTPVFYRLFKDKGDRGEFQLFNRPIAINNNGLFSLEYYTQTHGGKKSVIKQEKFRMDFLPPQIQIRIKRGSGPDKIMVIFEPTENTTIYYTLDKSDPLSSATSRTIGNKFLNEQPVIEVAREENLVLSYIGEDIADNRSELYSANLSLPTVAPRPLPGEYNTIIYVTLESPNNVAIYYTLDGSTPTERSKLYTVPVTIGKSVKLRFFAIDDLGYRSPQYVSEYKLDLPPRADFSLNRQEIYTDQVFILDPLLSIDEETPSAQLLFRWDFDSDKKFDTDFRKYKKKSLSFSRAGKHFVTLEVKDKKGLIGSARKSISVKKKCPKNMVSIFYDTLSFCMDLYEFPNQRAKQPLTHATWVEAFMYCRDINKRLCSLDEWKAACGGTMNLSYPYSNQYNSSKCNSTQGEISKSGSFRKCKSDFGIYDLAGNLWEWVSDRREGNNIIAGGSFHYGSGAGCRTSFYNNIAKQSPTVGFRCCK